MWYAAVMSAKPTHQSIDEIVVHTRLEDGRKVCLRAIRPNDEERMRRGIALLSNESRYLRFFSGAPALPDPVVARLVAVDGHRHLAWGAILTDDPAHPAIGAVHAIRDTTNSDRAEFAVGILDAYHGLGLARMLTAVLLIHCRREGIASIDVQILTENDAAAGLVLSLGGVRCGATQGISEFVLDIAQALSSLRAARTPEGLADVFAAFRGSD